MVIGDANIRPITSIKSVMTLVNATVGQGGLGLIDPLTQSRALLAKMVVRGLLPSKECWKVLLRNKLQAGTPKYGRH